MYRRLRFRVGLLALTQGPQHLSLEGKDPDLHYPLHGLPEELREPGDKSGPRLALELRSSIGAPILLHSLLPLLNLTSP